MSGSPPRLLDPERRQGKATQASVIALLLLGAALVDPDHPLPVEVCVFKALTGLPCPTCGLTRALCHALRGDWAQSLAYHPAGLLLAAALTGWAAWSAAEVFRDKPIEEVLRGRIGASLMGAGAVVSVVSWIVRLT